VDKHPDHYYQPGFLFMPFGIYSERGRGEAEAEVHRQRESSTCRPPVERIEAEANKVHLDGGKTLDYDVLIVATGTEPAPDETEGMTGPDWRDRAPSTPSRAPGR
jgi:sulfide:quinone oxidoreductase